jgi:hypothetical protein
MIHLAKSGLLLGLLLFVGAAAPVAAADAPGADAPTTGPARQDADGFVPLFNGRDLAGWVPMNVASGTASDTFTVKDGMIVSTGKPTGVMRTDRMYENFVVEMEWKHLTPAGNAGLFIWGDGVTAPGTPFARGVEVQILDEAYITNNPKVGEWATGQGDVFAIHGATMVPDRPHPKGAMRCLPSERRTKPAGEWNHYRVECVDGVIKLAVNGKVVSGATKCNPRKGYICLESEGAPAHFRNLRVKELPSSGAKPEETAKADPGYKLIYNGLDLAGWSADAGTKGHWLTKDWVLAYDDKGGAKDNTLWTQKRYGDCELLADWRLTAKPRRVRKPVVLPTGKVATNDDGTERTAEVDDAGAAGIVLRGRPEARVDLWCAPGGSGGVEGYRADPAKPASVRAGVTPKVAADKKVGQWNRVVVTLRGDRLTVVLNGKAVVEDAELQGIPATGPIGLAAGIVGAADGGSPIEFANLFVRELDPNDGRGDSKR